MNNRISVRLLPIAACLVAGVLGQAQEDRGKPVPRDILAKGDKVSRLIDRGEGLLAIGKAGEAVDVMLQAVALENTIGDGFRSSANYALARALTQAGRDEEALKAYRSSVEWSEKAGDLEVNGPLLEPLAMDYAALLAKCGHDAEAKEIYYFGLRNLNPYGERRFEPIPFIVVFDPDPNGVYWEYSRTKLEAAALMAKAGQMQNHDEATAEKARKLAPDWFYPVLWQANRHGNARKSKLFDLAQQLAQPGLEQELLRSYPVDTTGFGPDMMDGNARRARIAVLKPNELMLKRLSANATRH
jgi:tetratricopeptide (TPR) repeat protein